MKNKILKVVAVICIITSFFVCYFANEMYYKKVSDNDIEQVFMSYEDDIYGYSFLSYNLESKFFKIVELHKYSNNVVILELDESSLVVNIDGFKIVNNRLYFNVIYKDYSVIKYINLNKGLATYDLFSNNCIIDEYKVMNDRVYYKDECGSFNYYDSVTDNIIKIDSLSYDNVFEKIDDNYNYSDNYLYVFGKLLTTDSSKRKLYYDGSLIFSAKDKDIINIKYSDDKVLFEVSNDDSKKYYVYDLKNYEVKDLVYLDNVVFNIVTLYKK